MSRQGDDTLTFLSANARHDFFVSELRICVMLNELLNIIDASQQIIDDVFNDRKSVVERNSLFFYTYSLAMQLSIK